MAEYVWETSRTFNEFLLLPNLTRRDNTPAQTDLTTPVARFRRGEKSRLMMNVPCVSAIMQSVSDDVVAIALARSGGVAFIYHSQTIEEQARMVRRVKAYKAGFVVSDSNIAPSMTAAQAYEISETTGHSTIAVTEDGTANGVFIGLMTGKDYPRGDSSSGKLVSELMVPAANLQTGSVDSSLDEAANLIWSSKQDCLPILDDAGRLQHLVFRKDFQSHDRFPLELVDAEQRLIVGAGINTHDYAMRVPVLLEAGADALCLDSSDGYTEYQAEAIAHIKSSHGDHVIVGAGNVVDGRAFRYLAEAGADFIKVGVGGGSICITREQKGIGRGQASAVIDVVRERDAYFEETGEYVPICSDGGILYDYQIALALAMGADFIMLGRYFARFEQSPGRKIKIGGSLFKEYWAEGSERAKNWARYDVGGKQKLQFEEGVDGYVPYAGDLNQIVDLTMTKLRSTMCNCGSKTLAEFTRDARLVNVSQQSFLEGSFTIERKEKEPA